MFNLPVKTFVYCHGSPIVVPLILVPDCLFCFYCGETFVYLEHMWTMHNWERAIFVYSPDSGITVPDVRRHKYEMVHNSDFPCCWFWYTSLGFKGDCRLAPWRLMAFLRHKIFWIIAHVIPHLFLLELFHVSIRSPYLVSGLFSAWLLKGSWIIYINTPPFFHKT